MSTHRALIVIEASVHDYTEHSVDHYTSCNFVFLSKEVEELEAKRLLDEFLLNFKSNTRENYYGHLYDTEEIVLATVLPINTILSSNFSHVEETFEEALEKYQQGKFIHYSL